METDKGKEKMHSLYQPLDPSRKEIRLLRILPDNSVHTWPETKGAIHCYMHQEYLDEGTRYDALSYTWQDPGLGEKFNHPDIPDLTLIIDEFIFLNGQRVNVTRNLWVALWHLRYIAQDYAENPNCHDLKFRHWQRLVDTKEDLQFSHTSLWVDALCINQADDDERGHQVGMMGEIYKRAQCVHAWLGLSTEETFDAMVLMKHLDAMIEPRKLVEFLNDNDDLDRFRHIFGNSDDESSKGASDKEQISFEDGDSC